MYRFLLCLCVLAWPAAAQPTPLGGRPIQSKQQPPGSLTGRVLDASTGEPIRGANVMFHNYRNGGAKAAVSDANGQFSATDLIPGECYLMVTHPDYPGLLGLLQSGVFAEVQPGKETTDVVVKLSPSGSVYGRVLDDGGEPIANCQTVLLQTPIGNSPMRQQGFAQTNDKGDFRIAPVPPDRYLLAARCGGSLPTEHLLDVVGPSGFEAAESWQPVYYPSSPTITGASEIGITPGAGVQVEFQLKPTPVVTLTGVLTAAPGVSWKNTPNVMLTPDALPNDSSRMIGVYVDQKTNTFRAPTVPPGAYRLIANVYDGGPGPSSTASLSITVGQTAPPPINLQLQPGATITGKVEDVSGEDLPPVPSSRAAQFERFQGPSNASNQVQPKGAITLNSIDARGFTSSQYGQVSAADGSFQIRGLTPGSWRVQYQSFQKPAWIESIQYGDAPVENQEIEVTQGASAIMNIRLSSKMPKVKYELKEANQTARTLWTLQAMPARSLGPNQQTFISMVQSGQVMNATPLAPGRYHFFAIEQAYGGGAMNDRLSGLLRRQVEPTEVVAGQDQTISVKCFSSSDIQRIVTNFIAGEGR